MVNLKYFRMIAVFEPTCTNCMVGCYASELTKIQTRQKLFLGNTLGLAFNLGGCAVKIFIDASVMSSLFKISDRANADRVQSEHQKNGGPGSGS